MTQERPRRGRQAWGFWSSLGWAMLGYLLIALAQFAAGVFTAIRSVLSLPKEERVALSSPAELAAFMEKDLALGSAFALAFAVVLPMIVGLAYFAAQRCAGLGVRAYLGFTPVGLRDVLGWFGILFLFMAMVALVDSIAGRSQLPESMVALFDTAESPPLLFFSVIIAGPMCEEVLYRGLVLPGMAWSRAGPVAAVTLLSALWAASHLQYDAYHMAQIFFLGVIFGASRLQTGSVLPAISMHMSVNAISMILYSSYSSTA